MLSSTTPNHEDLADLEYRQAERDAREALEARYDAAERLAPLLTLAISRAVAVRAGKAA